MSWYFEVLRKYAVFSGRAHRMEYWMFVLINLIILFLLIIIEDMLGFAPGADVGVLATFYNLAVLIPTLAVAVRRLHDTGRTGWWVLIGLIPIIGALVLIIFFVQDSEPGQNQYGPNPKFAAAA